MMNERETFRDENAEEKKQIKTTSVPTVIVWRNVGFFVYFHLAAIYGIYLCYTSAMWRTIIAAFVLYILSGIGVTAGAHRLWSHRSYKAKFPLRILLAFLQTLSFQGHIYDWVRDHRAHHKFSETDADPHNSTRGLFFSHVGWTLCKKHPDVVTKGKQLDLTDLLADPIVTFQKAHYLKLAIVIAFVIPTIIPMYFWREGFVNAFVICALLRYVFTLHCTWFINSIAHKWGNRPYDKNINPADNILVNFAVIGEGFHK